MISPPSTHNCYGSECFDLDCPLCEADCQAPLSYFLERLVLTGHGCSQCGERGHPSPLTFYNITTRRKIHHRCATPKLMEAYKGVKLGTEGWRLMCVPCAEHDMAEAALLCNKPWSQYELDMLIPRETLRDEMFPVVGV